MQISTHEVYRVREAASRRKDERAQAPISTVADLAAQQGVSMDEVRRFTERAMMSEEDPLRERRVRELARRIAEGNYRIDSEDLVDMAERRAIADRSGQL
ncbi:MAG: flagellar biosynthesis anti-sigma factor FlgM [Armatimonadota bacterium]